MFCLQGRRDCVVRRSARWIGLLEPLTCLKLQVRRRGGGLGFVQECVLDKTFSSLLKDFSALEWAGHLVRLWLQVFPQDQEGDGEASYRLLRMSLEGLDLGFEPAWVVSWCESQLFRLLGLQPQLESCVRCGSLELSHFSSRGGGGVCMACAGAEDSRLTPSVLAWMRFLGRSSLRVAVGGRPRGDEVQALRHFHESWLHQHLPRRAI